MANNVVQTPEEAGFKARPEYAVPLELALRMVRIVPEYNCGEDCPGGEHVHSIVMAGPAALGAHVCLSRFREVIEERGIERSGDNATAAGYGLTTWRQNGPGARDPEGFHAVFYDTVPGAETMA